MCYFPDEVYGGYCPSAGGGKPGHGGSQPASPFGSGPSYSLDQYRRLSGSAREWRCDSAGSTCAILGRNRIYQRPLFASSSFSPERASVRMGQKSSLPRCLDFCAERGFLLYLRPADEPLSPQLISRSKPILPASDSPDSLESIAPRKARRCGTQRI